MTRLDRRGLRRARARAQLLDRSPPPVGVADVVSGVLGLQAQDGTAAALSVRARSHGLVLADVGAALTDARSVVLTWSLRGTRHLHHRADVGWVVGLLRPVLGRARGRAQQLGIAGETGAIAVEALRQALSSEGPLTRSQVKDRLARHGVDPTGQAAIHVVRRAALEGIVCVVPEPDGSERYALLDEWIGPTPRVHPERAAEQLARRYLAAHGPATTDDFARWCGLGTGAAREAWARIAPEMTAVDVSGVDVAGRTWWILASSRGEVEAAAGRRAPLRLLGAFDTLLLGYADRTDLLAPEHSRRVNAGGGMVKPVVLTDGEVVGTWRMGRTRRSRRVEVEPFRPLHRRELPELEVEAADIGRFLGEDGPPAVVVRP